MNIICKEVESSIIKLLNIGVDELEIALRILSKYGIIVRRYENTYIEDRSIRYRNELIRTIINENKFKIIDLSNDKWLGLWLNKAMFEVRDEYKFRVERFKGKLIMPDNNKFIYNTNAILRDIDEIEFRGKREKYIDSRYISNISGVKRIIIINNL